MKRNVVYLACMGLVVMLLAACTTTSGPLPLLSAYADDPDVKLQSCQLV